MDGRQAGDELVAEFARWAADRRAADAAEARTRERWLVEQASSTATWTGILVDLAETRAAVTLAVGAERRSGRLVGAGRDFCVLDGRGGRPALIAHGAIGALWVDEGGATARAGAGAGGSRPPALALSLLDALVALAEDRAPVRLSVAGGHLVDGTLAAVGEDVVTVRRGPPGRRAVHVPAASVTICELR